MSHLIDNVNILIPYHIETPQDFSPFYFHNNLFNPYYRKDGVLSCYRSDFKGLFVTYFPNSERIRIKNSIHKYAHGTNGDDLPMSEVPLIIESISDNLAIPRQSVLNGTIHGFEFGVNINHPHKETLLKGLKMRNGTDLLPMTDGKEVYGLSIVRDQYRHKYYDKHFEQLREGRFLPPESLRIELRVDKMQYVTKTLRLNISTLQDLISKGNIERLSQALLNTFKSLTMKTNIDYSILSVQELKILAYFENESILGNLKKNIASKSFERYISDYKRIMSKFPSDIVTNTANLIERKTLEMMDY